MTRAPGQNLFALVAYVPDPLASFLYEMRQNFTGLPCPQPHITILPPRPLRVPSEDACHSVRETIQSRPEFEVRLSRVCCFTNTNTIYLDIADGTAAIHALHDALNRGVLNHQEEFDFRPHLTIAGPIPPLHLTTILHQAEKEWHARPHPDSFVLSEIACLLQTGDGIWHRLWSVKLSSPSSEANEDIGQLVQKHGAAN